MHSPFRFSPLLSSSDATPFQGFLHTRDQPLLSRLGLFLLLRRVFARSRKLGCNKGSFHYWESPPLFGSRSSNLVLDLSNSFFGLFLDDLAQRGKTPPPPPNSRSQNFFGFFFFWGVHPFPLMVKTSAMPDPSLPPLAQFIIEIGLPIGIFLDCGELPRRKAPLARPSPFSSLLGGPFPLSYTSLLFFSPGADAEFLTSPFFPRTRQTPSSLGRESCFCRILAL